MTPLKWTFHYSINSIILTVPFQLKFLVISRILVADNKNT